MAASIAAELTLPPGWPVCSPAHTDDCYSMLGDSITGKYPHHESRTTTTHSNMVNVAERNKRGKLTQPRWCITHRQLARLEDIFLSNRSPAVSFRIQLAKEFDATPRQVSIWFRNRRQRQRLAQSAGGLKRDTTDIEINGDEENDYMHSDSTEQHCTSSLRADILEQMPPKQPSMIRHPTSCNLTE